MLDKEQKRKGLGILGVIVKIIIPVMIGAAILGSLQSIKTSSLDPKVDETKGILDQAGTTKYTIQAGDAETAKKQMQGLIVWNMLAASDCRILTGAHTLSVVYTESGEPVMHFPPDVFLNGGDVRKGGETVNVDAVKSNNINGFTGNFEGFGPLINGGFSAGCTGTKSATDEMQDQIESATSGFLGSIGSALVTIGAAGLTLAACSSGVGTVACIGAGAVAVTAVASDAGDFVGSKTGEILVPGASGDLVEEPGFDMEGRFGKIEWNSKKSFLLAETGHNTPLLGFGTKITNNKGDAPGFWRGKRFSYMLPASLEPPNQNEVRYHRIYGEAENILKDDFGDGSQKELFYAFRPRMKNFPIIASEELTSDVLEEDCGGDSCTRRVKMLRNFLDRTSYLVCKGAQGFIQSNAGGSINNGAEAGGDKSWIEDQVYPLVEITENATVCMPTQDTRGVIQADDDRGSISCDSGRDIVSGSSETLFERPKANGRPHRAKLVCGGDEETAELREYGNVDYYLPQKYITGCVPRWYTITQDAETSRAQQSGDSIVLEDQDSPPEAQWSHSYDQNYDGDDVNEGENQITYSTIKVAYGHNDTHFNTFVIELRGKSAPADFLEAGASALRDMFGAGGGSAETVAKRIVVQDSPDDYVGRGGTLDRVNIRLIDGDTIVSETETDALIPQIEGRNVVKIERPEDRILFNDNEVLTGELTDMTVEEITIRPVENADSMNSRYGIDGSDSWSIQNNEADLEIQGVNVIGKPRTCYQ